MGAARRQHLCTTEIYRSRSGCIGPEECISTSRQKKKRNCNKKYRGYCLPISKPGIVSANTPTSFPPSPPPPSTSYIPTPFFCTWLPSPRRWLSPTARQERRPAFKSVSPPNLYTHIAAPLTPPPQSSSEDPPVQQPRPCYYTPSFSAHHRPCRVRNFRLCRPAVSKSSPEHNSVDTPNHCLKETTVYL